MPRRKGEFDGETPFAAVKERAWQEIDAIDDALATGRLTEAGWYREIQALYVPAYLSATNPRAQSGHSCDEARWEAARRLVVDAIDRSGSFLDIGCAGGLLMECVADWAAAVGHQVESYGLDIVPALADLARRRLPGHAHRIFVGNALDWSGARTFDFVRTGLDYVPMPRRQQLVEHLLGAVVSGGGRLIIGPHTEMWDEPTLEATVTSWGHKIAGRSERPHPDQRAARRLLWIDNRADDASHVPHPAIAKEPTDD